MFFNTNQLIVNNSYKFYIIYLFKYTYNGTRFISKSVVIEFENFILTAILTSADEF